ncbi:MAG TPA: Hsp20/alpha crystallin family protein [Bacteroidia bacterium]|nr:Hsp20/alpha crystallin family protein [Bacteroidia bacterium]
MSLIKRNNGNAPSTRTFFSDFFDADRFFREPFLSVTDGEWVPAVNVVENEKDFSIELAAPGFKKSDFKVNVENGILNISAEKKTEKEEKEKNYTRREFSYNSFSRSFSLPENSNEENVAAKYDDGVLKLTLAKKVPGSPKAKKEVEVA